MVHWLYFYVSGQLSNRSTKFPSVAKLDFEVEFCFLSLLMLEQLASDV